MYFLEMDSLFDRPRVKSESVSLDGKLIFKFAEGEVQLYNDSAEPTLTYPIDSYRSALATVRQGRDNEGLIRFRHWLGGLVCVRMNPFAMEPLAETAQPKASVDLSNIALWYRHFEQFSAENGALIASLGAALDGFVDLPLLPAGGARVLVAQFVEAGGRRVEFSFSELSEGQRCLICLYAILHFVLAKGNTVILDEPDNFISLREIQPWLMAASDMVDEKGGQLLIISHHPEFIDQWASSYGVQFVRHGLGPVRTLSSRTGRTRMGEWVRPHSSSASWKTRGINSSYTVSAPRRLLWSLSTRIQAALFNVNSDSRVGLRRPEARGLLT